MTHLCHIGKGTRIPLWQYHSSSGTMLCTAPADKSSAADTLTHQFSKISSPTHAAFTSSLQYNHHHGRPRGYFETHCATFFIKPTLHTSSNGGEFWWLKRVLLIKPNHTKNFSTWPQFQSGWHCASTYPSNSIQVPDLCHLLLLPSQVQPLTNQQAQMLQAKMPCPLDMPCKIC